MVWRFKDQSMVFKLGEDFVFDHQLAQALVDNQSPTRPLPEHFLLLGRVCFVWGRGDREWPVIRKKGERDEMSLRDALKVLSFSDLVFDFDELAEDEELLLKQTSSSPQEIRPLAEQNTSEPPAVETTLLNSNLSKRPPGHLMFRLGRSLREKVLTVIWKLGA
ncbi:hypothetical protein HanPI659440_Chr11g0422961 [Helianthus annuus]|nr:hypothetical protein HanPI659440_Chr11g0422961 [Helianthus annuus]